MVKGIPGKKVKSDKPASVTKKSITKRIKDGFVDKSGEPKKGLRSRGLTTIDTDTKYTKKKQK